jgi:hypothetical protein
MRCKLAIERLQSLLVVGYSLNMHPQPGSGGCTAKEYPRWLANSRKLERPYV